MASLFTRRDAIVSGLAAFISSTRVSAAPVAYRLNAPRSTVGFGVDLGGQMIRGTMPVSRADLALDFGQISNSSVTVDLDAAGTSMGVFFATDAVRSAALLDAANHPIIRFNSISVRQGTTAAEAIVDGTITIKGVTGPVTLRTILTQERATVGHVNPELTLALRGTVDRNRFGITAYQGLVGPDVSLDIRARIQRA